MDPWASPNAFAYLQRDVENVCRYFARYGVEAGALAIATWLWRRFVTGEL